jgi:hypothetical protein
MDSDKVPLTALDFWVAFKQRAQTTGMEEAADDDDAELKGIEVKYPKKGRDGKVDWTLEVELS